MQLEQSIDCTLQEWTDLKLNNLRIDRKQRITEDIFSSLKLGEAESITGTCLAKHSITAELRSRMIDWMIEVLAQYRTSGQTFFLAVKIMDKYFQKCTESLPATKLHLVGVTSMFIASKFEDIYSLRLKIVYEKIAHKRLSEKSIRKMEQKILRTLKFDLAIPNCADFLGYLCEIVNPSLAIRRTAELILVLLQIYYNTGLLPSQEATAALIIAANSLRQERLVPKILDASECSEFDMAFVVDRILRGIYDFPRNLGSFKSAMKFLGFSLILRTPGPLFVFEDLDVQADQEQLLTIFN
ncbi:unnamed protein product [Blepharisma stoltei]|uniref:Cyclin-like domain-containing protein n=1 Tax=Blepharisma stoltei TaxID=1481888 RepID=A0AAU9IT37_9CILI|nr:unnamed protein product [Blepharisma stoltei]